MEKNLLRYLIIVCLFFSLNGKELGVHFIGGKPLKADLTLGIYKNVE